MKTPSKPKTFTVTVMTRHSEDCPKTDPQWKRCRCRKSLYIYENGKDSRRSAKTRSWEEAERQAQLLRDAHNPVHIQLKRIADTEQAKLDAAAAARAANITVEKAADQWLAAQKSAEPGSLKVYKVFVRKVKEWAAENGIRYLCDITPASLDLWRSQWDPGAERKNDQMGPTSQWNFQSRLKGFFDWSTRLQLVEKDPSLGLDSIEPSNERTMPLNREQYAQLLAATDNWDKDQRYKYGKVGDELRTLFLIMRWTGLRITDVLMMKRSNLKGNEIDLITRKTKAHFQITLPKVVVEAIETHLKPHDRVDPRYFFWSGKCSVDTLTTTWIKRIRQLNKYLSFVDDDGEPMEFRSHMLRDTFAVEMLLAGVALEDVSKLLTHASIVTTEKYYARWVKARQLQLDDKASAAMRIMGMEV